MRWIGARERCASATIWTMRASIVSRPTFSARITRAAGLVDRAADDLIARPCFVTGIDSPVTIDSSSEERPSSTTPSTGTFSPGRTRRLSPTDQRARAGTSPRRYRRRRCGARSWAPDRAAPGSRPKSFAGAQFQHLAEQHQHGDDRRRLEIDRDRAIHPRKAAGKIPGASVATTL
jgi:hypothetical protein